MKNLEIWKANEKTQKDSTKDASMGGRSITSINAITQLEAATKQFGPYGKGFGLKQTDFEYIDMSNGQKMAHLKAVFFYIHDGEHSEFPISSTIIMVSKSKNGLYIDKDWAKKIETDVTTKALSKLGFNADIFKGNWDDDKYVQERVNEERILQSRFDAIIGMIKTKFVGEKKEFADLLINIDPQEQAKWIELFNDTQANHERTEIVDRLGVCRNRQERQASYSLFMENKNIKV